MREGEEVMLNILLLQHEAKIDELGLYIKGSIVHMTPTNAWSRGKKYTTCFQRDSFQDSTPVF